jgi:hypothetical protein
MNDINSNENNSKVGEKHDWHTTISMNSTSEWERKISLEITMFLGKPQMHISDPIIESNIPFEIIDIWNSFCIVYNTIDCYETNGGVSVENGNLLDITQDWIVKDFYKKSMISFSIRHRVLYYDLLELDRRIRVKKARGHKWVLLTGANGNRKLCMAFLLDKEHFQKYKLGIEGTHAPLIIQIV